MTPRAYAAVAVVALGIGCTTERRPPRERVIEPEPTRAGVETREVSGPGYSWRVPRRWHPNARGAYVDPIANRTAYVFVRAPFGGTFDGFIAQFMTIEAKKGADPRVKPVRMRGRDGYLFSFTNDGVRTTGVGFPAGDGFITLSCTEIAGLETSDECMTVIRSLQITAAAPATPREPPPSTSPGASRSTGATI